MNTEKIDSDNLCSSVFICGKNERAVALVITLLMLSVITFLAIAFLAMTRRDRSAVTATLDLDTAKSMSDAALARAQAETIAQMMSAGDILSYDYRVSHNYITPPANFISGNANFNNVNYDLLIASGGSSAANATNWAQNINNLFYDPRPPVFVMTNGNLTSPAYDFRYWVDINRNGNFESNGLVQAIDQNGNIISGVSNLVNGEPEWIGVLKYPETNHSSSNPFIGRYAFMVLPIGKTLDWNFIHNYSKFAALIGGNTTMTGDAFIRDEGVGSWELNLAGFLDALSPAMMYQANPPYNYIPGSGQNTGGAFDDASQILGFRYGHNAKFPQTLANVFGNADLTSIGTNAIDEYATSPRLDYPFDYTGVNPINASWPGSYNLNMFYDVQDLFDPNKTGLDFYTRLTNAVAQVDTTDRYTFQRLLASIGTSSAPEYGVYVYSNLITYANITTPDALPAPSWLRTKVNINYDNTAQIQAGPYDSYGAYTPMPTNLVPWTPLGFFTNAADLLLRSQVFVFTNYVPNGAGQYYIPANSNYVLTTFGITNIPVYVATNPGICYNEQVHRMLQMAANIYAAANPVYSAEGVPQPPVFRPQFSVIPSGVSNVSITITNFVQVTGATAYAQINKGFYDLTNSAAAMQNDPNFWGVPWVIGAVKGLPAFDQYSYQSRVFLQRQLLFVRKPGAIAGQGSTSTPPYTNQFYEFAISNICGMDAWNPYNTPFAGSGNGVYVVAYSTTTVTLTNNYDWGTNINVSSYQASSNVNSASAWAASTFKTFLQTNFISLPFGYYSETAGPNGGFVPFPPGAAITATNPGFLAQDLNQTAYPTHNWTVTVTNHMYYALFDGAAGTGNVLDFVNLGPFGSSFAISHYLTNNGSYQAMWALGTATDLPNSPISSGVVRQIGQSEEGNNQFTLSVLGISGGYPATTTFFGPPLPAGQSVLGPYAIYTDTNGWMACDPLVHYTLGDLITPALEFPNNIQPVPSLTSPLVLSIGSVTTRYKTGIANTDTVFGDPGMTNANAWQFPTNLFPGVGWLGRVHRGTPWQTIYLKSDDPNPQTSYQNWSPNWVNSPFTYPTNDWSIVDLFTAVPNDNAARGLLSVNQTNDAAWAAVFAGVIVITNSTDGVPLNPTNDVYYLMDTPTDGINAVRAAQPNQIFHKIGDILQAATLANSPPEPATGPLTDEMVERIPQQTLSLLKLGLPQFVIYSWGQSLKPKSLYSGSGNLNNICTNYEITGEFLTRTVCHVVSDPGAANPKIIIDNYNIEPGN